MPSGPVRPALPAGPFLALFVAMILAACESAATPSPSPSAAAIATAAPPATVAPTASPSPVPAFPITVTDDDGTAVTLPSEPQKIVSLTPAVTETLFAVGAGDRVVAADDASDYPPEAKDLPDVVIFGTVDVEKIVSLAPDLVFAGGAGFTSADAITQLRAVKIPVLVVSSATLDQIGKDILLVGTAVGATEPATALVEAMQADMTAVGTATQVAAGAAGPKPRVFYDVGYLDTTGQIYGAGAGSFLAEMLDMLGVDAITGDATTYEVPLEKLVERDPQVIILGTNAFYMPTPQTIAKRTGWAGLTAVKTGNVRSVNDTEITRPGPRLATGFRNLAMAMYPDLVLPWPAPSATP